ncbi:hypothetical protein ABZ924_31725 [Streptomyces sp. NPDC046876]|uniref:hypothetical protein n=1 Tax=Streptomyces sp. NPDC046876 TaxID=3155616 RepID=UPI0033FB2623
MNATIPVNSQWLNPADPTHRPTEWSTVPGLRDISLLPQAVTRTTIKPYRRDGKAISLELQKGIIRS